MPELEILCVTMHQKDFSKLRQMNIHCDVVFANQADRTGREELGFEGHRARMITTDTRGVGINRNLSLMYARGEICMLADDDVVYYDTMPEQVLSEFSAHPEADVMIFHFETQSDRTMKKYPRTKKCGPFSRMPWGAFQIAFRREAVAKANLWFTTLFGGGCLFPAGEDSMWLAEARKKGMAIYVSRETLGTVNHSQSTWFTGYDEKYYFGQGAYYQAARPKTVGIWLLYSLFRTKGCGNLTAREKARWFRKGISGYRNLQGYPSFADQKQQV